MNWEYYKIWKKICQCFLLKTLTGQQMLRSSLSVEMQFGCNAVKMVPWASVSVPVGAVDAWHAVRMVQTSGRMPVAQMPAGPRYCSETFFTVVIDIHSLPPDKIQYRKFRCMMYTVLFADHPHDIPGTCKCRVYEYAGYADMSCIWKCRVCKNAGCQNPAGIFDPSEKPGYISDEKPDSRIKHKIRCRKPLKPHGRFPRGSLAVTGGASRL